MPIIEQLLILALIGTILSLDVTLAGQLLLSRPIVVLTLIGFFMSDPLAGFTLGVILELVCADMIPLGVVIPLDTAVMSTVAGGVFFMGNISTAPQTMTAALVFAFVAGVVFRWYDLWFKKKSSVVFSHLCETQAYLDKVITFVIVSNVFVTMLRNFVFLVIALGVTCYTADAILMILPVWMLKGLVIFDKILPVFALSLALSSFRTAKAGA